MNFWPYYNLCITWCILMGHISIKMKQFLISYEKSIYVLNWRKSISNCNYTLTQNWLIFNDDGAFRQAVDFTCFGILTIGLFLLTNSKQIITHVNGSYNFQFTTKYNWLFVGKVSTNVQFTKTNRLHLSTIFLLIDRRRGHNNKKKNAVGENCGKKKLPKISKSTENSYSKYVIFRFKKFNAINAFVGFVEFLSKVVWTLFWLFVYCSG